MTNVKHKPTSPLPWLGGQTITAAAPDRPRGSHARIVVAQRINRPGDAEYMIRAANHYPELVVALRGFIYANANREKMPADIDAVNMANASALLRELGEMDPLFLCEDCRAPHGYEASMYCRDCSSRRESEGE